MPNSSGWFVRAVMPDVSWQGKNSIFSTFGRKFVEAGTITLAELDEIAGDPLHRSRAAEGGEVYDGSDYLGPAVERLRTVVKKDDQEEPAVA
ncbi:hypothetical protein KDA14_03045 [Candidatus Saccharibacteria bacterium]|nr:hypothetical protein [Candidatus Saccharibacteria bacterium]